MKEGWEVKKLTDVCHIQYGYAFDSSCFCDDDSYPQLIRIRDVVRGYSETFYNGNIPEGYFVYKGDYLIGMDGEFHIAPWQSEKALLNQRVCKISASDCDVDERFIYYTMSVVLKQIEDETPFVTVKHLSAKRLNLVKIPIPPLPEQSRIVEELDQLSNIIEKKRQQLSELDNLAQSIFYDMFGDPNNSIYEVIKLSEIAKCKMSYGSGASAIQYDGNIRYIRITDIKEDGTLSDEKMSPNVVDDKYMLYEGDILFARSGATVGKTYLYNNKDGKSIYAGYLIRFVANTNIVIPKYIYYYTRTTYYKAFIAASAQAVAQPNINAQQFGNLKVCVPPLSLQQLFAQKIEAIEKEKELIKQSIKETEILYLSRMNFYFK